MRPDSRSNHDLRFWQSRLSGPCFARLEPAALLKLPHQLLGFRAAPPPTHSYNSQLAHAMSRSHGHCNQKGVLALTGTLYPFPQVYLRGLDAGAIYRVAVIDGKLAADASSGAGGANRMDHGVELEPQGDYRAAAFTLERAGPEQNRQ